MACSALYDVIGIHFRIVTTGAMANRAGLVKGVLQATAIQRWKPWEKSTGPKTPEGKAVVSRNAFKGGKRPLLRAKLREIREALGVLDLYDRFL